MASEAESIHSLIRDRIKSSFPTADHFTFELASEDILGNQVYYVEWVSSKRGGDETLCYALVDKKGQLRIFDDGILAVQYIHDMLEKRRSLIQRLSEFSLFELVAAVIALSVTAIVIYQVLAKGVLTQELVGIFGIILGYYFGKTETKGR
jgi:hypothetical protein